MSTALEAAPPATTAPAIDLEDEILTIRRMSWDQYVAINDAMEDHPLVRVLYLDGSLTFVSPAYVHSWMEDAIDTIIKAIAIGCEIELRPIGSTTLRRQAGKAGAEGDKVYYLRDNALRMSQPDPIDLTRDPAPDLAVEVENTHKATDAMAIYARLGVPEVWRHGVKRKTLTFWALGIDGTYSEIPQSLGFPFLKPADVQKQLQQAEESGSFNRWFAQLTDWVRDVIHPRLDRP